MRLDLMQGTLDMLLLKSLSWGPKHGYGIVRWLEQQTNGALQVDEGSLYPALHRMAARGWLKAEWGVSENNRRARFYTITPAGRRQFRAETDTWERFLDAVRKVLTAQHA